MRSRTSAILVASLVALASAGLAGCMGSNKPFRPYKGEPRPLENPPPDPAIEKLRLETMTYDDNQRDLYFTQSRKAIRAVTTSVPHNPWQSYESEMTNDRMKFLLGPLSNIKKADVVNPEDAKKKAAEEEAQPTAPAKKEGDEGEKPAEKKEGE